MLIHGMNIQVGSEITYMGSWFVQTGIVMEIAPWIKVRWDGNDNSSIYSYSYSYSDFWSRVVLICKGNK